MIRKDLRDRRAALLAQNRGLTDLATTEKRELTADELTQFEARMADIDKLSKQIGLEERQAEAEAARELGRGSGNGSENNDDDTLGCRNFGHFIHQVRFNPGELRTRATMTTDDAAFFIPTQFRSELMQVDPETSIVRPRATVIPAGDPPDAAVTIPTLNQASGFYGGVAVQWIAEGATKPETNMALSEITLTPHEVAATMTVTDKLLRNWAAADALLKKLLRGAMVSAEDWAFLRGDGVAKPRGVLNALARILVTRNTAAHVKFQDIAAMLGKMLPDSLGRAVWVANISILPDLVQMASDSGGVSTVFIRGDVTKKLPDTLFGMPLYFTGKTPVLGSQGDLMLVDLTQYLIKDGSGPFVAASPHLLFRENKTVIKAFWNVDGDGWMQAPITLEDGSTTVSPFVILN